MGMHGYRKYNFFNSLQWTIDLTLLRVAQYDDELGTLTLNPTKHH